MSQPLPDPGSRSALPPNLLYHTDEVRPLVRRKPMGLVVDFDGTISEIAPTPDEARIAPACVGPLSSLATKLSLVAVISGRSVYDLKGKVGLEDLVYVGNHGAEYLVGEQLTLAPGAGRRRAQLHTAVGHLRSIADGPGLIWQDKGLSASVHYRRAPNPEQARRTLATALETLPDEGCLEIFWGKLVLELRPATGLTKGYALGKLARERRLSAVIYLGDDTTDVDALRSLKELAAGGEVLTLGIAVLHDDTPEALLEAADYSLVGVGGVRDLLRWLDSETG